MPALQPPPRHPSVNLTDGKTDCPRCGGRYLNPDLRCTACSADFTPAGIEHFRSLPEAQARRA